MRFVDVMLAFPAIFLLLIFFSIQGSSVLTVIVFLGLFSWMWLARVIRGEFLSLKQRDFIEAGALDRRPGWPPHLAASPAERRRRDHRFHHARHRLRHALRGHAFLPWIRRSGRARRPGAICSTRRGRTTFTSPLLAIAPGLTLTIAVLAINFVGDGLRDALDPRGRG